MELHNNGMVELIYLERRNKVVFCSVHCKEDNGKELSLTHCARGWLAGELQSMQ
jgi:hypothetical protein